eukprot:scaffold109629_cov21-Tisochrysis_lutea.AAC.2
MGLGRRCLQLCTGEKQPCMLHDDQEASCGEAAQLVCTFKSNICMQLCARKPACVCACVCALSKAVFSGAGLCLEFAALAQETLPPCLKGRAAMLLNLYQRPFLNVPQTISPHLDQQHLAVLAGTEKILAQGAQALGPELTTITGPNRYRPPAGFMNEDMSPENMEVCVCGRARMCLCMPVPVSEVRAGAAVGMHARTAAMGMRRSGCEPAWRKFLWSSCCLECDWPCNGSSNRVNLPCLAVAKYRQWYVCNAYLTEVTGSGRLAVAASLVH